MTNKRSNEPLVSIGMALYNGEHFLRQTLDSLLAQSYENFELIISDDASTDNSQEVCREYLAKNKRIKYYRNETNLREAGNHNRAFELSSGEYFMWASGHDKWDKDFLSCCVETLNNDSSVVLCYTYSMFIDLDDKEIGIFPHHLDTLSVTDASHRFRLIMWNPTCDISIYGLMRTSAIRKTHLFQPVIGFDHVFLAEMSLLGTFVEITLPLFHYRKTNVEESERATNRRLESIAPNMNKRFPFTLLMFHHLVAAKNTEIGYLDKLKLMVDILRYFTTRSDVLDELPILTYLLSIYRKVRKIV